MSKPFILFEWDNNFAFGYTPTTFVKYQEGCGVQEIVDKHLQYVGQEDKFKVTKIWHHISIAFYMLSSDPGSRQSEV